MWNDYMKTGKDIARDAFTELSRHHVYYVTEDFIKQIHKSAKDKVERDFDILEIPFHNGIFFNFERPLKTDIPLNPEPHPTIGPRLKNESVMIRAIAMKPMDDLNYRRVSFHEGIQGEQELNRGFRIIFFTGTHYQHGFTFHIWNRYNIPSVTVLGCDALTDDGRRYLKKPINGACKYRDGMIMAWSMGQFGEAAWNEMTDNAALCMTEGEGSCPFLKTAYPVIQLVKKIVWAFNYHPIEYKEKKVSRSGTFKKIERKSGEKIPTIGLPKLKVVPVKPLEPTEITIDPEEKEPESRSKRTYSSPVSGHYRCYTRCQMCNKRIKVKERHLTECPYCHRELELEADYTWINDTWSPADPSLPRIDTQHNVES
jgi:hypothetical protein